jgi:hypothetical protein
MTRILAILFLAVTALCGAAAAADPATDQAVVKKLYDLGYPTDEKVAIQRWRADTDRLGTGPLSDEEKTALLAHPMPEFFAAMAGNPFTGMGLAVRHKTREDAERDAEQLCRKQGGGATCVAPMVTRTEHCVVIVGYTATINRRPTYRTSVAVSPDIDLSHQRAMEGCQSGASHPKMCRPLVSYCGDGRSLKMYDDEPTTEAAARGAR